MNDQELRAEIERLGPWHHDIELAPGVTTSARDASDADHRFEEHYSPSDMMEHLIGNLYPAGLQSRSFLDCACNSGGHSLAAARLGAGRIFAFDARQHWVDQAQFLARQANVANMTTRRCTLGELPALGLDPYDVTLFAGIFYHLPDPIAGLRIAADLTKEILIVNTATRASRIPGLVLNKESPTHVLSGVDSLAWLPTGPAVMRDVLAWCGFEHSRIDLYWGSGPKGWKRLQMVAARDPRALADYDRARPDARDVPGFRRRLAFYLWRLKERRRAARESRAS